MKSVVRVILFALSVQFVLSIVCPGGRVTCPGSSTCCELRTGQEGCCPFANATCCSDKIHCCPQGSYCKSRSCQKHDESGEIEFVPLMTLSYEEPDNYIVENNQYANESSVEIGSVVCPDGSQCADGQTCCSMGHESFGCCPMDAAVCCRDLKTCCPHGYTCEGRGFCKRVGDNEYVKASPVNTICPGGRETCPAGDTCCPRSYGHYGCCPLLAATCCNDQLTCCPHGYRCDGRGHCLP